MLMSWLFREDPPEEHVFVTKFMLSEVSSSGMSNVPNELRDHLDSMTKDWKEDVKFVEGHRRGESDMLPALSIVFVNPEDTTAFTLKYGHLYQFADNQDWIFLK